MEQNVITFEYTPTNDETALNTISRDLYKENWSGIPAEVGDIVILKCSPSDDDTAVNPVLLMVTANEEDTFTLSVKNDRKLELGTEPLELKLSPLILT